MPLDTDAKPSRGDRRRGAILEAATEVFLERGFEGATLDEIIRRSGGSRATLYAQFGDKQGLFAAIIGELCERILKPLSPSTGEEQDPRSALLAFGRTYLRILMAPESIALYRVVIAASLRSSTLGARVFAAGPEVAARRLADYLRREAARGRLKLQDPAGAARVFLEMVKSDVHTRALFGGGPPPTADEVDGCVQAAVDLFCNAVCTNA